METSKTSRINIVIWGETEGDARILIGKLLNSKSTYEWMEELEGVEVYGYIRFPGNPPLASPQGITDILLVLLTKDETDDWFSKNQWESARNYIDNRRGIPFKFLTSSADLSEKATKLGVEFLKESDLTGGEALKKLVNSALTLEHTLRSAFHAIDSDKDGFIDESEILNASKNLNHPLNDEDAKEIAKSLSNNGKISYEKFKQWWVMGRTDFNSFRKLVGIELVVNNLIQKSSSTFNTYLENIAKEGNNSKSDQSGFSSRVNIVPHVDFNSGSALNLHVTLGNEFTGIASSLPSYLNEAPVSFGIEFKLKNAESGPMVIEVLEGVKELAGQMIPDADQYYQAGLSIKFRHVGTSVFIDVSYGGMLGDKISGLLSMFNVSSLNFSGESDVHLCSKLSPVDVLDFGLVEIIDTFANLKFEGKGEYTHLKTVFSFAINTLTALNHGTLPKKLKAVSYALKVASIIKKLDFKFTYDSSVVSDFVKELINSLGYHESSEFTRLQIKEKEWKEGIQQELKSKVDQFAAMGAMFLEAYKPAILAIDLDNISILATCPILKIFVKLSITLRKISEFVEKTLG